jgi:protein-S-isoprenylcysteine O-methyltransferase Ste14
MFTTIGAYLLIGFFFVGIENRLRQGQQAKSWRVGQYDQNSQAILTIALGLIFVVLLLAPGLNHFQVAPVHPAGLIGGLGLVIMMAGTGLRYWAAKTLGEYYMRTLQIKTQHAVVEIGPYHVIRHPGYLGVILMFLGAGLAVVNWIAIVVIPVVLLLAYHYRIRVEEKMLQSALGEPYTDYMGRSWRLIPYVY